jgi:hypothetical protein
MTTLDAPYVVFPRPAELPFEAIKARAQSHFARELEAKDANPGVYLGKKSPSDSALVSFACMPARERDALRNFILTLSPPARHDMTAVIADARAEGGLHDWSCLLMQVRTMGLRRISNWDIRCVDRLIELFPNCVPRSWRKAEFTGYVDDRSGGWMVCARRAPVRPAISRSAPSGAGMV